MEVEPTKVTNLVRAVGSRIYYLRLKVRRRIVWRSLETKSFSVAKLRLPDELKKLRETAPAEVKLEPKITFGQAVEIYKKQVNDNPRLKPRAKLFRLRSEHTLRRTWPDVFDFELRRITPEACKLWLQDFENGGSVYRPPRAQSATRPGNSPTTVNAAIAFLRHVFAIGIKAGIAYQNPAMQLSKKKPRRKMQRLPNKSQFAQMGKKGGRPD